MTSVSYSSQLYPQNFIGRASVSFEKTKYFKTNRQKQQIKNDAIFQRVHQGLDVFFLVLGQVSRTVSQQSESEMRHYAIYHIFSTNKLKAGSTGTNKGETTINQGPCLDRCKSRSTIGFFFIGILVAAPNSLVE